MMTINTTNNMSTKTRQAIIVTDLGYGDAGKGSIVDYLTRLHQAHTVIRYNGGSQAAHNVVAPDGRHHTFAQFGSGMFVPGTRTYLSRFMLVNPLNMLNEERHLQSLGIDDAFARTSIDRDAVIITPFQQAANRIRELARNDKRHGSCGQGIGETMSDYLAFGEDFLLAGDLSNWSTVVRKLRFIREIKICQLKDLVAQKSTSDAFLEEWALFEDSEVIEYCADIYQHFSEQVNIVDERFLADLFQEPGTIIFEGAQGVLLDEWHGFHPYTTWSTTTNQNADDLLAEQHYSGQITRLGLLRAYATRHGAGPFVTENDALTNQMQDEHNTLNPWQQGFRVGHFDLVAARYALEVTGTLDGLAISHLDRLSEIPDAKICTAYCYLHLLESGDDSMPDLERFFELSDGLITRIKVHHPADLEHQEQLTRLLMCCTPHYVDNSGAEIAGIFRDLPQRQSALLSTLEHELGLSVAITSHGLTALDKHCTALWSGQESEPIGVTIQRDTL